MSKQEVQDETLGATAQADETTRDEPAQERTGRPLRRDDQVPKDKDGRVKELRSNKPPNVAKKNDQGRFYTATILPNDSSPFETEVEMGEDGTITYEKWQWVVAPNSAYLGGDGRRRIILPEAAAQSLNGAFVRGITFFTCAMFFFFRKLDTLKQLFEIQDEKKWYKQSGTWLTVAAIFTLVGVAVWLTIAVGGGFEGIEDAIKGIPEKIQVMYGQEGGASNATAHQPIAPGGV